MRQKPKDLLKTALKTYSPFIIAVIIAIMLSSVQLLPSFEYMNNAYRWVGGDNPVGPHEKVPFSIYSSKCILEPKALCNLFYPNISPVRDGNDPYFGIVPLLLILSLIYFKKDKSKESPWFLIAMIALLISIGKYNPLLYLYYMIPFADKVREPGRTIYLFHFSASVLSGLSADYFFQRLSSLKSKLFGSALITLIFFSVLFNAYYFKSGLMGSKSS